MRNLQEQVKKAFCYQKLFGPLTVWINCSSDLKIFANSWPSALNFKRFSRSLEHFFLTVGQNNFGNKIPFISCKTHLVFVLCQSTKTLKDAILNLGVDLFLELNSVFCQVCLLKSQLARSLLCVFYAWESIVLPVGIQTSYKEIRNWYVISKCC